MEIRAFGSTDVIPRSTVHQNKYSPELCKRKMLIPQNCFWTFQHLCFKCTTKNIWWKVVAQHRRKTIFCSLSRIYPGIFLVRRDKFLFFPLQICIDLQNSSALQYIHVQTVFGDRITICCVFFLVQSNSKSSLTRDTACYRFLHAWI